MLSAKTNYSVQHKDNRLIKITYFYYNYTKLVLTKNAKNWFKDYIITTVY